MKIEGQKGTTTVGILCKDGVVLAADKRASAGYLISSKDVDKVSKISNNMALTMAGLVSDAQLLTKLIKAELTLRKIRTSREVRVKESANLLAMMLYNNIRKMSMVPGIVSFVLGGKDDHGFHLYELGVDGSVTVAKDYRSVGSGSMMALGVLETLYKEDLTIKEGIEIAVKAINAAVQRDLATGNGIDLFVIDKNGVHKKFTKEIDTKITA
ncbi:proteasome subunit beta [archaeon]|nr:proteasome subunit beta [archaeon]|tara:strand:- start:3878 stop:4513 length:636 start_codon:yes stop_codon:yes gene_type:complete